MFNFQPDGKNSLSTNPLWLYILVKKGIFLKKYKLNLWLFRTSFVHSDKKNEVLSDLATVCSK